MSQRRQLRRENHHYHGDDEQNRAHQAHQRREESPRLGLFALFPETRKYRNKSQRNRAARHQIIEIIGQIEGDRISVGRRGWHQSRDELSLQKPGESRQKIKRRQNEHRLHRARGAGASGRNCGGRRGNGH